jgi:hypothetical protein
MSSTVPDEPSWADFYHSPSGLTVTVTDPRFGAKGDGITDDTAALQAALDAWQQTGGTLFFPAGIYVISETLRIGAEEEGRRPDKFIGGRIANEVGNPSRINLAPGTGTTVDDVPCALVWQGRRGGVMVEYWGSGLTWDGPALWGRYRGNPARAGVGLQMRKASGIGSGKVNFIQLNVTECDIALHGAGETNVDLCSFWRSNITSCDVAFQMESSQNVSHAWYYTFLYHVGTGWYYKTASQAQMVTVEADYVETLLRADHGSPYSGGIYFRCVKLDGNHDTHTVLVDLGHTADVYPHYLNVVLENVTRPAHLVDDRTQFFLRGRSKLTVRNMMGLNKPCFRLTGGIKPVKVARIAFEDCVLRGTRVAEYIESVNRTSAYRFTNCMNESDNRPVAELVEGPPPLAWT